MLTRQQFLAYDVPVSETRWLDEREARMWRSYVHMQRAIGQAIERQLAEEGLSGADYELLVPLSEAPDHVLRARDLGRGVGWDRSRLAHQLRRMEQRGLVRRFDCPTDARGTMVELTPAGLELITTAAPGHVETVRRCFVDLLDAGRDRDDDGDHGAGLSRHRALRRRRRGVRPSCRSRRPVAERTALQASVCRTCALV
jgi:DNA-binding MarR family transcriptional regulator